MGLLDSFGIDDPQTMGLLSAAGNMMAASGPSRMPVSLGQVANAGLQGLVTGSRSQYQQNQIQKMNELKLLSDQVGLQTALARLGYVKQLAGDDSTAAPSQVRAPEPREDFTAAQGVLVPGAPGGVGPTIANAAQIPQVAAVPPADRDMQTLQNAQLLKALRDGQITQEQYTQISAKLNGDQGTGAQPGNSGVAPAPAQASNNGGSRLRALAGLAMLDGKLDTAYNIQKDMLTGFQRQPGNFYVDPRTGVMSYIADPNKGFDYDPATKTVSALKGFSAANAGIEGAKTEATVRATNNNTLAPLDRIDPTTSRPYSMTVGQLVNAVSPSSGNASQFSRLGPATQAAVRRVQELDPSGNYTFDFAGQNGERIRGQVPTDNGFHGFAGPTDAAVAAARVKQQMDPRTAYDTATAANMAEYEKGLNGRVSSGQDLMMRINESRDALTKFQSGGGMEARQQLAKYAQAIGAPGALVDRLAGGDLSAAQEFQKLSAQQAMEALKQAMGGSGRISQAEFKVFQQNNPNLDTDPRAIEKVFNFATKVYQRDKAEQDALASYKRIPGADISAFPNWWAGQSGVPAEQVEGAARGTQPPATAGRKVATLSDIAATARASGKSTKQVTADLRAAGYTIGGQ